MKQRMMNSKFGKLLRRLAVEEAGQTIMEYVIIAVLVAAAAVIAIAYFGKTATSEANIAATAMTGQGNVASDKQQEIQQKQSQYQSEAVDTNKKFSDAKEDAVKQ